MESSRFFLDANNNLKIQIKAILFNRGTIFYDTFWYRDWSLVCRDSSQG
jgi:hypothetical protein